MPTAPYTEAEHAVWAMILRELAPVHDRWVCRELLALRAAFPLDAQRIPQLEALNARLSLHTGFRMEPVAGLVAARTFLGYLGSQIFLSTQYIRHASRPLYTPEPDVVHELVGHAFTLAHPGIAALNQTIGRVAESATPDQITRLERIYWYSLEFGVVEQDGQLRAFGAGLLSSFGELGTFATRAELREWDLDRIAETPYDPTDYQPWIYVAPSFDRLLGDLIGWIEAGAWK